MPARRALKGEEMRTHFSARDGDVAGPPPGGAREMWKLRVTLGSSQAQLSHPGL